MATTLVCGSTASVTFTATHKTLTWTLHPLSDFTLIGFSWNLYNFTTYSYTLTIDGVTVATGASQGMATVTMSPVDFVAGVDRVFKITYATAPTVVYLSNAPAPYPQGWSPFTVTNQVENANPLPVPAVYTVTVPDGAAAPMGDEVYQDIGPQGSTLAVPTHGRIYPWVTPPPGPEGPPGEPGDLLPDQTGQGGKFLKTDGTSPSWAVPAGGGGGGDVGIEFVQASPAATWTIPLPGTVSRKMSVSLWIDGEEVEADTTQDDTNVYVTLPSPMSGTAVLN